MNKYVGLYIANKVDLYWQKVVLWLFLTNAYCLTGYISRILLRYCLYFMDLVLLHHYSHHYLISELANTIDSNISYITA